MPKLKTTEEFRKELFTVNPNIEVCGEYINSNAKIPCRCRICNHVWEPTPSNLLRGHGCPACSGNIKKNTSGFIHELQKINPNIEVLGEYVDSHKSIKCKCLICGHIWSSAATNLLRNHGCPKCSGNAKKTHLSFQKELALKNPNIELLGDYINDRTSLKCRCLICGTTWGGVPSNLLRGEGCPTCAQVQRSIKRTKTHEFFISQMQSVNPNIEILGQYNRDNKHIACKCRICGYEWNPTAGELLQGHGCIKCSYVKRAEQSRKSQEDFVKEVADINPTVTIIGDYISRQSTIRCSCNNCGHIWNPLAGNLLHGYGCPKCSKSGTSFMEQLILTAFESAIDIPNAVISRDKSTIGMELDILIPAFSIAIEPGSWAYHKKALKKDFEKKYRCFNKGIRLIIIYDSFQEETPPFDTDCLTYSFDLGSERNHKTLKEEVIPFLFSQVGISKVFSDDEWIQMEKSAKENSLSLGTESFKAKVAEKLPTVMVLGEYVNNKTPVLCMCTKCGYKWDAYPSNLTRGRGCYNCTHKISRRKSNEEYIEELQKVHPDIQLVSTYISATKKVKCHCKTCENEWEVFPYKLLVGRGCPKCNHTMAMKVINIDTQMVFQSLNAAAKSCGLKSGSTIALCCRGKRNTAGGYHWRFSTDNHS
jgi:predicted  nucleic acid-binding Zn-ribbon protein